MDVEKIAQNTTYRKKDDCRFNQIKLKHSLETFNHNKKIKIFWIHNAHVTFNGEGVMLGPGAVDQEEEIVQLDRQITRNPGDVLGRHLNCHTKQSTM